MQAYLALEDGAVYRGQALGAGGRTSGEVVFNTGMTGYQEVLSDPSYCGQIVTMTYPLIGNYGLNQQDLESGGPQVRGFVVHQGCDVPSNWRAETGLDRYLAEHGIVAIQGVDTRALTKRLRSKGTMRGVLATGEVDPEELAAEARRIPGISGQNLVDQVTTPKTYQVGSGRFHVVLVDFGVKQSIVRWLVDSGCRVTVVPARATAAEILAHRPDGLFLANGPGDPEDVPWAVATLKELLGRLPIFGICLGHQLLGLALGGRTYKLTFGHRGVNHPVKDLASGRVYITSQNHGFALDAASLPESVIVSHVNLNDQTVEGLRHRELPAFSVQFHPEASPGPTDCNYLFQDFVRLMSA